MGEQRVVRLRFAVKNRREGDVQAVHVELTGDGSPNPRTSRRLRRSGRPSTVTKEMNRPLRNGIAVEGYQKSNLKGEGLNDLHYGVLIEDIIPEFDCVKLRVLDVKNEKPKSAEFRLPTLEEGKNPVNSRVGFEEESFRRQVGN